MEPRMDGSRSKLSRRCEEWEIIGGKSVRSVINFWRNTLPGGRKSNVRWRCVGNSWIGWKTDGNEIWLARWKSDASAGSKGPTLIWSAKCRRWLRGWIDSVGVGGAPWATIEGERQRKGGEREGAYVHRCRCARVRRAKPGCRSVVVGDSKQFQECVACVSSALIWFTNRFLRPDYPLVVQLYLHPATYPPKPSLPGVRCPRFTELTRPFAREIRPIHHRPGECLRRDAPPLPVHRSFTRAVYASRNPSILPSIDRAIRARTTPGSTIVPSYWSLNFSNFHVPLFIEL